MAKNIRGRNADRQHIGYIIGTEFFSLDNARAKSSSY